MRNGIFVEKYEKKLSYFVKVNSAFKSGFLRDLFSENDNDFTVSYITYVRTAHKSFTHKIK